MRWVYILKCENDHYYVGETKRLYRRFWEHLGGNGSLNTLVYKPEEISAIYQVNVITNFIDYNNSVNAFLNQDKESSCSYDYKKIDALKQLKFWDRHCDETKWYGENDNLIAENNITECLMIHNPNEWSQIRGGKYTRFDANYQYPINECIQDLPLCYCGLPCDIKKNNEKNILFFRCAKKNMWVKFKDIFKIHEKPCCFYEEYSKDRSFRLELKHKDEERSKILKELFKKSHWLENLELYNNSECDAMDGCIKCGEDRQKNLLSRYDKKIMLCFDCFINYNDELSKEYGFNGKCLINL